MLIDGDENLKSENILYGVTIFGVEGELLLEDEETSITLCTGEITLTTEKEGVMAAFVNEYMEMEFIDLYYGEPITISMAYGTIFHIIEAEFSDGSSVFAPDLELLGKESTNWGCASYGDFSLEVH